ncbi:MAG: PaaI family thioesterase [Desulfocapsaceae bacterium]|nr:PaaI family thioesterase [Desulfocapsaceae bacterium]
MTEKPIQHHYADEYAHCYGCGRLNDHGLQIKSYVDGDETVCHFTPGHKYSGGFPGFLYGGMIASLMDCHGAATAWAAMAGMEPLPLSRFVTASLKIDYRAPTPINIEIEIRGKVSQIKGLKVVVDLTLSAGGKLYAEGSAVMVQIPIDKKGREDGDKP